MEEKFSQMDEGANTSSVHGMITILISTELKCSSTCHVCFVFFLFKLSVLNKQKHVTQTDDEGEGEGEGEGEEQEAVATDESLRV